MLLVARPLDPDSPELARANFLDRWSFRYPTCYRMRCFRYDASLALQPIRRFSLDSAFPRWPIQMEVRSGKYSATEWDCGRFLDDRSRRDPAGTVRAL